MERMFDKCFRHLRACRLARGANSRTVVLVAMQARSVRRVLLARHIRWLRRVARALGSPCAQSSPAPPNAHQVRKGARILLLGNVATSGRSFSSRAPRQTGPKRLRFVLSKAPAATPDHLGGASCILPYFLHITRITRPIAPYFLHITRITRQKKKIV